MDRVRALMGTLVTVEADEYEQGQYDKVHYRAALYGAMQDLREQEPEAYARYNRDKQLRRMYGISVSDKETLVMAQGGRCRICGQLFKSGLDTHVDHEHCGLKRVRAVLCHTCNQRVGLVERELYRCLDDAAVPLSELDMQERPWLSDVIAYLESYELDF